MEREPRDDTQEGRDLEMLKDGTHPAYDRHYIKMLKRARKLVRDAGFPGDEPDNNLVTAVFEKIATPLVYLIKAETYRMER